METVGYTKYPLLAEALEEIEGYVDISSEELKLKEGVIKAILEYILPKLKEPHNEEHLAVLKLFHVGSANENLQSGKMTDYDVQLMLTLPGEAKDWYAQPVDNDVGEWNELCYTGTDSSLQQFLHRGKLSSLEVHQSIGNRIDQILEDKKFLRKMEQLCISGSNPMPVITSKRRGPAVTLVIKTENPVKSDFTLDLVACVRAIDISGNYSEPDYVPKPYNKIDVTQYPTWWRASYSRKEIKAYKELEEGSGVQKHVVRILKLFAKVNENIDRIKSFLFKNLMLHLDQRLPNAEVWKDEYLPDRFVDMVLLIKDCLVKQYLPAFFNRKLNLLARIQREKWQNTTNFLKNITDGNTDKKYATFVHQMLKLLKDNKEFHDLNDTKVAADMRKKYRGTGCKIRVTIDYIKIDKALRQIDHDSVGIRKQELEQKKELVKQVGSVLQQLPNLDVFYAGSAFMKTHTGERSDFDLHLMIKLSTKPSDWLIIDHENSGKWKSLKYCGMADTYVSMYLDDYNQLSAFKVRKVIHSRIEKILTGRFTNGLRVKLSEKGAEITLTLKTQKLTFSANLVPVIQGSDVGSSDCNFVPTYFNQSSSMASLGYAWETSFAQREKQIFDELEKKNQVHTPILRILKLAFRHNATTSLFSNYVLKNVMLQAMYEYPSDNEWRNDQLAHRFVDVLELYRDMLADKCVPIFLEKEEVPTNLLQGYSKSSVQQVVDHLDQRVLRRGTEGFIGLIAPLIAAEPKYNRPPQVPRTTGG